MTLTKQQKEMLFQKLRKGDFDLLRAYLKEQIEASLSELSLASEQVQIYRSQGEVRALKKLLGKVTEQHG